MTRAKKQSDAPLNGRAKKRPAALLNGRAPAKAPWGAGRVLKPLTLVAALVALWALLGASGLWSEYVLPGPDKVWRAFVRLLETGALREDVWISLVRVLKGFSISFALALLLGALASLAPRLSAWYDPLLEFMRNVPPIALIALLILWFGIGETSKIIVIVLASFFPMFLSIRKGFEGCDARLLAVGRSFGFSRGRQFLKIVLPAAVPDVLVGMRIGLGYSWRAIIGAEMFAASAGLGHLILYSQQMSRSDRVIVGIIMIGLVGLACDALFRLLIRKMLGRGEAYAVGQD
ncbi:MAG: ABC transporter permease [Clostridia bacterium]